MITIIIQDKTMTIQDEERKTYDIHRKEKRNIKTQKRKAAAENDSAFLFYSNSLNLWPRFE